MSDMTYKEAFSILKATLARRRDYKNGNKKATVSYNDDQTMQDGLLASVLYQTGDVNVYF